jgi:hypothetical protein
MSTGIVHFFFGCCRRVLLRSHGCNNLCAMSRSQLPMPCNWCAVSQSSHVRACTSQLLVAWHNGLDRQSWWSPTPCPPKHASDVIPHTKESMLCTTGRTDPGQTKSAATVIPHKDTAAPSAYHTHHAATSVTPCNPSPPSCCRVPTKTTGSCCCMQNLSVQPQPVLKSFPVYARHMPAGLLLQGPQQIVLSIRLLLELPPAQL